MIGRLGRPAMASCWVLLPLPVLAHVGMAVLAVTEFALMGWPLPTWFDTVAVTLVLATAAGGLAAGAHLVVRVGGAFPGLAGPVPPPQGPRSPLFPDTTGPPGPS